KPDNRVAEVGNFEHKIATVNNSFHVHKGIVIRVIPEYFKFVAAFQLIGYQDFNLVLPSKSSTTLPSSNQ
ncbi:MAG TPA: hypothetical protein PLG48_04915, partial [Candidatus Avimonas sp.]|nr:hypothetical protein [Candidatus Avimonas sp.]